MARLDPLEIVAKARDQASAVLGRTLAATKTWGAGARRAAYDVRQGFQTLRGAIFSVEGAISGLVGGSLVALVSSAIATAEGLDKMSQRVDVSVERLSTLGFAAEQAGANVDVLERAMKAQSKTSQDAARGKGEAIQAYKDFGIAVTDSDGKLKSSEALLLDTADAFARHRDGAEKSAAAQRIFGEAGTQLIPLLNQGAEGIKKVEERARSLGLEISTRTAKQAAELTDRLNELKRVGGAVALTFADVLMPAMRSVTESFLNGYQAGGLFQGAVAALEASFLSLRVAAGTEAAGGIDELQIHIAELTKEIDHNQRRLKAQADEFNSLPNAYDYQRSERLRQMQALQNEIKTQLDLLRDFEEDLAGRISPNQSFSLPAVPDRPAIGDGVEGIRSGREEALAAQIEFDLLFQSQEVSHQEELTRLVEAAIDDRNTKVGKGQDAFLAMRQRGNAMSKQLDSQLWASAIGLAQAGGEKLFYLSQALQLGRVIQGTSAAVMSIFADPLIPLPAKPALAGKMKAVGVLEGASILATTFGGGGGGGGGSSFGSFGGAGSGTASPTSPFQPPPIPLPTDPADSRELTIRIVSDQNLADFGLTIGEVIERHKADRRIVSVTT